MAAGRQGSDGIAGDLVRGGRAHRAQQVAEYLDERNPGELVEGVARVGPAPAGRLPDRRRGWSGLLVGRLRRNGAAPAGRRTAEEEACGKPPLPRRGTGCVEVTG